MKQKTQKEKQATEIRQSMTAGHVAVSRIIANITRNVQRYTEIRSRAKMLHSNSNRKEVLALRHSRNQLVFFSDTLI